MTPDRLRVAREWLAQRLEVWRKLDVAGHGDAYRILSELLALDRILNGHRKQEAATR